MMQLADCVCIYNLLTDVHVEHVVIELLMVENCMKFNSKFSKKYFREFPQLYSPGIALLHTYAAANLENVLGRDQLGPRSVMV